MSVWVVVGGQFGSEGKGKISAYITEAEGIDACVRCGGPNSGHCFVDDNGRLIKLRQLPTGYIRPGTELFIPAGGLIDLNVLKSEIDTFAVDHHRLHIDADAMIVLDQDRAAERARDLNERHGSTLSGTGSAVARRALRERDVVLARDATPNAPWLAKYLVFNTASELNRLVDSGKKVLVEGTQGCGLSLFHSGHYPKVTSRDTTASGFLSECGLSPFLVTEIVLVIRTFPIRVWGEQSGPLPGEIDWNTLEEESRQGHSVAEYTTVTNKLRRIARFDFEQVKRAVLLNRPSKIALNFLDYLDAANRAAVEYELLTDATKIFVDKLQSSLAVPVQYLGVGPSLSETLEVKPVLQSTSGILSAVRKYGIDRSGAAEVA